MKKFVKTIAAVALIALAVVTLVSCGFSSAGDPDKDKEKLSKMGYTGIDVEQYTEAQEDGLIAKLSASKVRVKETIRSITFIRIYYYDTAANAKTAYGVQQESIEKMSSFLTGDWDNDVKLQGKVVVWTQTSK